MKYTTTTNVSYSMLRDALLIDQQVFGDRSAEYRVCRYWLDKNSESFIILLDQQKNAVGYICFLPLKESVYQDYLDGKIHEYALRSKDILRYENGKTYSCLYCCIIIDKDHHNKLATSTLVQGYKDLMQSLKDRNITISRIVADCVTDKGVQFALREGLRPIKSYDGGQIFEKVLLK